MKSNGTIATTPITLSSNIRYNNIPILTYQITYPNLTSATPLLGPWTINDFYVTRARGFQNYIHTYLKKQAIDDYILRGSTPETAPVYQVMSNFTTPYLDNETISFYTDDYLYLGGAHGSTTRFAETWDLKTGEIVLLTDYFPDLKAIEMNIIGQIEEQIRNGNNIYFENYKDLVHQTLSAEQFYLVPGNIIIYFQQYDIGPYVSGIIEFKFDCNGSCN